MIAGYKINIQKPITVLYTHNGQSENGLRKFHLQQYQKRIRNKVFNKKLKLKTTKYYIDRNERRLK